MDFSKVKKFATAQNAMYFAISVVVVLMIVYGVRMMMSKDNFNTLARAFGQETKMEMEMTMPEMDMAEKDFVASNSRAIVPQDFLPTNLQAADFDKEFPASNVENNFLVAGHHIGINTVSSSLKNANTQIRSDPYVPVVPTGLWNQSTITPDLNRRKLDFDDCEKM